ncbi:MAG: META domain-containing protein [Chloroflexota bacterium]
MSQQDTPVTPDTPVTAEWVSTVDDRRAWGQGSLILGDQPVQILVQNLTDKTLEFVQIGYPHQTLYFSRVAAGTISPAQLIPRTYQSMDITVRTDDKVYRQQTSDMEAERDNSITEGRYMIVIDIQNETLVANMEPMSILNSEGLPVIDAFIRQFRRGVDGEISSFPHIVRQTIFDTVMGKNVTAGRETIRIEGDGFEYERIEAYIMYSNAVAKSAARTVQPGGKLLTWGLSGGRSNTVVVKTPVGRIPKWWHYDRMILMYHGDNETILEQLNNVTQMPPIASQFAQPEEAPQSQVRLLNMGNIALSDISITIGDDLLSFGRLNPYQTSDYQPVDYIYEYTHLRATPDNQPDLRRSLNTNPKSNLTILDPGAYTLAIDISAKDGDSGMVYMDEETPFIDDELINKKWFWEFAILPEDSTTKVRPSHHQSKPWPHVEFTSKDNPNGPGLWLSGETGCNYMAGVYFVNDNQQLVIPPIIMQAMFCGGMAGESEAIFSESLRGISRYEFLGDGRLEIYTPQGAMLVFSPKKPALQRLLIVTHENDKTEHTETCDASVMAQIVTDFFDAFNLGDRDEIAQFFGDTFDLYQVWENDPESQILTAYDAFAADESSMVVTGKRRPRDEIIPLLLDYFAKRGMQHEQLALVALQSRGDSVMFMARRQADDINPAWGPDFHAFGRGIINCADRTIEMMNLRMVAEPQTICPTSTGDWSPQKTTLVCDNGWPVPDSQPSPATLLDNTLILYTSPDDPIAKPIDQTWGLRAHPAIAPFDDPLFDSTYGQLAYGERLRLGFGRSASPDGRYLLISGLEPRTDVTQPYDSYLQLVDLRTGNHRQIAPSGRLITWSPTSDRFAYVDVNSLYVQLFDFPEPQLLFSHEELHGLFVKWSPDGQWIAVTTRHTGETEKPGASPPLTETLWLVSPDSGYVRELATIPTPPFEHAPQELAWSSDGQHIVFQDYVIDLTTAQPMEEMVRLEDVGIVNTWMPNKSQLLVKGQSGLRLINPNGDIIINFAEQDIHPLSPQISRAGDKLAFTLRDDYGTLLLFIYDFETEINWFVSNLSNLAPNGIGSLRWNADDTAIIFDNRQLQSPIWVIQAQPDSQPEVIIEDGLLINTYAMPAID